MVIKDWKRVLNSMRYFLKLIFFKKNFDVVFVCSTYFNRGKNGENILFKPMIECCKKNNLTYVVFEDTYFKSHIDFKVNENSIPFDFILIIQILLKKIYNLIYKQPISLDEIYLQDLKVAKIVRRLFFRKFNSKIYITLIWNNVTLWRVISPSASVVDYQHGYIFDGEEEFMKDGRPPRVKLDNNVEALVHGNKYKSILIDNDKSGFYNENNVITVGLKKPSHSKNNFSAMNRKILFTLQLVPDFDKKINERYVKTIEKLIDINSEYLLSNNYEIIFKHHPRYVSENSPKIKINHNFVSFDDKTPLSELFKKVSLHMTFHSTSAFDAALIGLPTIFVDMHESFSPDEMFVNQYQYPCNDLVVKNFKSFKHILKNIRNEKTYNHYCDDVYKWSKEFYHDFDEEIFENFLLNRINKQN